MTPSTPERQGIPTAAVLDLLDDLERPGVDPHGLVVARHGVPVVRGTWAPYREDLPGLVYSVSKTFTAVAIGHLVAEGQLTVDDPAGKILDLPDPTGITVGHLLTMNTGHTAEQVAEIGFASRRLLGTRPEHEPGTHFVYNSPASMTLSSIVTTLTGERLTDYLRPRVLDPLGIRDPWWVPHHDGGLGIEQGFSGLHLTTDHVARLAVAMAAGGRYDGAQVIPAAWVDAMQRPWSDNADSPDAAHDWAQGYGYQVWRSRRGFRADGAYGQFGLALPDLGLAIGYRGATRATHEVLDACWRFADRVAARGADGPLRPDPDAVARLGSRLAALDSWPPRLEPDPEPTPSDVVSPVPWTLRGHDVGSGTWQVDVGGRLLAVTEHAWRTHVVPWPHAAAAGEPYGTGSVTDPALVLALRARPAGAGDAVEVHAVVPTSPHRLVARGTPGARLDLAWTTTPLWRPGLDTLVVPAALARPVR
ncbi:serine hydrolase domain-containing protein [Krasilnikoviella flava]|uniref:CubicO group peptidase, beta-lactamase class C family n=1 Tax=Krasilnikoviella flava TaxID=526729 RepID=A0A1T5LEA0_9MICO|nr:serine hydrolase domain-containing protein [Krasilnikoviella flava]SKC74332.1 CubicO group peptidase, beta-lactamase class C family [Krasilnikoviella flava]